MKPTTYFCIFAVAALHGCGGDSGTPAVARPGPDPWSSALSVARATDLNPDPRVVEVNLDTRMGDWQIAPGQRVRAMT